MVVLPLCLTVMRFVLTKISYEAIGTHGAHLMSLTPLVPSIFCQPPAAEEAREDYDLDASTAS